MSNHVPPKPERINDLADEIEEVIGSGAHRAEIFVGGRTWQICSECLVTVLRKGALQLERDKGS